MKNRLLIFFGVSIGVLLFLSILFFGVAQTDWFQDLLMKKVAIEAKKQGITLETKNLKATAPFKWNIETVAFKLDDGTEVKADRLQIKLSPLSLLRKKLTVRFFSAEEIYIGFKPKEGSSSNIPTPQSFTLPFDLQLKTIACKKIVLENLDTYETLVFSFSGSFKFSNQDQEVNVDFLLEELRTFNSLEIIAIASQKHKNLEATAQLKLDNTKNLSYFFNLPSIPSLNTTCKLHGGYTKPLIFQIQGHVDSLLPYLVHPVDLDAKGQLDLDPKNPSFISLQKIQILDPDLDLSGSFILSKDLKPLACDLSLSLKEAGNFSYLLPLKGEIHSQIYLSKTSFLASLDSPSLTINKLTYEPVHFQISAGQEQNQWVGESHGTFKHALLPCKESCRFILKEDSIDLLDLSFSLGGAKLGGTLDYTFAKNTYQGSFFIMAEELRPFRLLFPDSEIDGKLGGSFTLSGNAKDLSLDLSCLLKSVRYQNSLIETARLEVKLENLITSPVGTFSCDAKNIFFRDMLLANFSLVSESTDQDLQTFDVEVNGDWKQELHFHSSGLWKKKENSWNVTLNSCEGSFLNESFSLQLPFSIQRSQTQFLIDPCHWKIGEGDLSTELSFNEKHLLFKGDGNHIPLGILGVLYPKMAFQGIASFQSSISGPPDEIKGHFFASLEKADFSQNRAKGSLQIHFNPLGMQIYSHLYATHNQFLDWTATLPVNYSFAPLSWKIDPIRPITSELTMQGAVEEIFDFVNTASHKAAGWITAHLFLSGNLQTPSLLGSLKCEQGAYENYFTGTQLKQIEGEIEASNHTLQLTTLKASDEKAGTLSADGSLLLAPEKGFPFEFKTDLKEMHVVHSDLIDSSLTGFLEITGNQNSSNASGNLTVDKALFKIFDELPYEIPTLPVTYINKPIHLQTSTLQSAIPYPLHLDIQLLAEDSVFVQGRGLDSNWSGSVQLTGTVASPSAKGSLILKKGEFVFSGKTFTLRQGEISFFDKPSPGAYLKISGELSLPSATILAQMQGPLTSPQLTFHAIPSLPTSSILSFILFDKDISEISALQALQLAQTIVSLSGKGGPGVLESIRKKIGVDRLNIVGKDGTDEISVQIGWYLNHGITLSLSQSATSSDVTVEVDLKNGFIFQAETQNQEEGKFSFKWNKNY